MRVEDKTERNIHISFTGDEISAILAKEIREVAQLPALAKEIHFDIEEDHTYFGMHKLTGATYHYKAAVK